MQIWRNVDQKLLGELLVLAARAYVDARETRSQDPVIEVAATAAASDACACGCGNHAEPAQALAGARQDLPTDRTLRLPTSHGRPA